MSIAGLETQRLVNTEHAIVERSGFGGQTMRLAVFSHKVCWTSASSPSGYVTDGGFPFQMSALSELFDKTTLVIPCSRGEEPTGVSPVSGRHLSVRPLTLPRGRGLWRKLFLPAWFLRNGAVIVREVLRADAVHAPIPGDIGTIGMLLAFILRKPLFVRHCGNWLVEKTVAEQFWKWFMERFAGGKQVMLATGGSLQSPSERNSAIRWIFSTALTENQLQSCQIRRERPAKNALRLIIACRQDVEKGAGVVIESLPLIFRSFPGAHLDVVGDGLALPEFKKQASSLGVEEFVTFHGRVDHKLVLKLLQRADVFCYPTAASEGFPKIVLEALACGLPVITTRVSVLPQLINTGCGVLLNERTPSALADALESILLDADVYRTTSDRASETAREYSLERWRDTVGELLRAAWSPGTF